MRLGGRTCLSLTQTVDIQRRGSSRDDEDDAGHVGGLGSV